MNSPGTRPRAVVGRWTDVGLLALSAYAAVMLVLVVADRPCAFIVAVPSWLWIPGLALVLVAGMSSLQAHPRALGGLRHFGFYPPSWVAALGAIGLLFAHLRLSPTLLHDFACPASVSLPSSSSLAVWAASISGTALLSWLVIGRRAARGEQAAILGSRADVATEESRSLSKASLFDWIATDAPVHRFGDDYFERGRLARRIATYLTAPSRPTLALVGPVGSGKSSIRLLVEHQLARQGHIGRSSVVCRVSLWTFDTNDAAIRGILNAVTTALADHISTVSLRGLPTEYVYAVESGPGGLATLGKLLRASPSPEAVLRKYDGAATAIGIRVVLWLEDLERYAGTTGVELKREVERLAPVRALLSALGDLHSVQVVLATSDTNAQFDLEKIARFVLPIPPLDSREVYRALVDFREACHRRTFLDPSEDERKTLWPVEDNADTRGILSIMGALTERTALGVICSTPRVLKQGLRSCKDAWDQLYGEIDFDDLLVISLLRVAEPEVFALIGRHNRELRFGTYPPAGKSERTVFSIELENLLNEKASSLRRSAVTKLVEFVFPGWKTGGRAAGKMRPQGFAAGHTDYWTRYLHVERPARHETDQPLLEAVLSSRAAFDPVLVETLVSGARDEALETFIETLLPPERLMALLERVVEAEKTRSPRDWKNGADSFGVISVWRMMLRQHPPSDHLSETLKSLLQTCLPKHLPLAQCLVHLFITSSKEVASLLEANQRGELRDVFVNAMVDAYRDAPQALADALRDAADYLLSWAVFGLDRIGSNNVLQGLPFTRWKEFSGALLEAAGRSPESVVPQLVRLLVDREAYIDHATEGSFMRARFVYRPGSAETLFDLKELSRVLEAGREVPSVRALPEFEAVASALLRVRASEDGAA